MFNRYVNLLPAKKQLKFLKLIGYEAHIEERFYGYKVVVTGHSSI